MKFCYGLIGLVLMSSVVFAKADIEVNGTIDYPLTPSSNNHRLNKPVKQKMIRLLKVTLSDNAWDKIEHYPVQSSVISISGHNHDVLPLQWQLGMDQVPVLDQGPYGTCVMFAVTAAVDAAMNQGDYISQLCQLELGQYLQQHGYHLSGWEGGFGLEVLNQMSTFGFVTKEQERLGVCGGLTQYPSNGVIPDVQMSPEDYHPLSQSMETASSSVGWSGIMDAFQAYIDGTDREAMLINVKQALTRGDRATLGVLLPAPFLGMAGAVGQYHVMNDTWIMAPQIEMALNSHGLVVGHEMIITGYDDHAVAVDGNGQKYSGLLTLRNSWGTGTGDGGNFYMSYDYFKRLAVEVYRIRHVIS